MLIIFSLLPHTAVFSQIFQVAPKIGNNRIVTITTREEQFSNILIILILAAKQLFPTKKNQNIIKIYTKLFENI